jgi:hypothetical protein
VPVEEPSTASLADIVGDVIEAMLKQAMTALLSNDRNEAICWLGTR